MRKCSDSGKRRLEILARRSILYAFGDVDEMLIAVVPK